jgi:hypothetical protein
MAFIAESIQVKALCVPDERKSTAGPRSHKRRPSPSDGYVREETMTISFRTRWTARLIRLVAVMAVAAQGLTASPPSSAESASASETVRIKVLSNRADLISGGDAYVEIVLPTGAAADGLNLSVDGRDVTNDFGVRGGGRILGVVGNLQLGSNSLEARLPDGRGARITIDNHPKGGPVFSGPQVWPWICETEASDLGKPKDRQCNAPTNIEFFYMSESSGQMENYDRKDPPPDSDVQKTETDQGKTVPFIVRRETGTQNRGIYQIAVLYPNPKKPWAPWDPQRGWNQKLAYPFGASCGTEYRQAAPEDVMDDFKLGRGFMVANSSLNVLGNNCNTVTSAESVMMLKEHIVETYGEIRYTIGQGCSGGSIGQQMVANTYPGLLQGIQPMCSYEDIYSTGNEVVDCHLLLHYFNETSPHLWANDQQRAAVNGHQTSSSCMAWEALFASVPDPETGCALPEDKQYNAESNPDGARCTTQDFQISIWGRRPRDQWIKPEKEIGHGFANAAYDNLGVQYGLNALNSGEITAEQFVDLNEKIGGLNIDFNFEKKRVKAWMPTIRTLYATGQVNEASHLDQVAIIDLRGTSNNEIHTDYHSYSMRARLDQANGHHDNQIIWTSPVSLVGDFSWGEQSFLLLDRWLERVEADHSDSSLEVKIVENKPAAAVDACWILGHKVTDMNKCRAAFPYFGAPRIAAGGPLTHEYSKCYLKPLKKADYEVSFSDSQWERLQKTFKAGACDYNRFPAGFSSTIPWLTFANGPGGRPLGAPPSSRAFGS